MLNTFGGQLTQMAEDNEKKEQDEEKWEYGTTMFDRMFGHGFVAGKVVKDSFKKKPLPEPEPNTHRTTGSRYEMNNNDR